MVNEHLFDSREELLAALQDECTSALQEALKERGKASLMVSGGSSPAPLYQRLSEVDLDWSAVSVALVDERWVEPGHEKSNETLVVNNLMQNRAAQASLTGMKNAAELPAQGLAECEAAYQKLPQPFDVTLLGMGPDGHTASLFPHADGLEKALDTSNDALCAAISAKQSEVTGEYTDRMTLSLKGLLNSRRLILLITGEDKLEAFRQAQSGSEVADMPIRAVLQQDQLPLTVYWAP
ncbi:6-phosphogluconolactonase [Marinimicrobium sp. ABcell2]|uniref:6-phosphogluconolactonase n=1 Tax=Marinimicrobium sp. ABcell2 TaxID=3069751 RepID=UPI0027AEAF9B|nr:6-phosphogluconolactonase [Marinimicrobium sp. ABcell2]MDQ2077184.1 6-phosphogluconolactonase [Marinimicrobium sp. ABcell2]